MAQNVFSLDVGIVLLLDTLAQEITVNNLTSPHPDSDLCLLAAWTIGDGEYVMNYYGYFRLCRPDQGDGTSEIRTGIE